MLVRFQPGPLDRDVYYVNGRPVEIVYVPKRNRPNVYFVRDVETRMCFVVEAYKLIHVRR